MPKNTTDQLRNTFAKFADGNIQPNNFGRALSHAIRDGFLDKETTARLLGVRPEQIRKKGNTLSLRDIQKVARAIVAKEP